MKTEDRVKYLSNGFNYVEITPSECFSWGGMCICNGCNKQVLDDNLYLVYVLGDTYCKECFYSWEKGAGKLSKEDLLSDLEQQKKYSLDFYKYYLG